MTDNQLGREISPYLLQHKDNPVHWRAWGPDALKEARDSGKPILLSVGYAACHWCHVMAHESFEDPNTAELMNRLFVNIKVDREERPDIDVIYQTALALLGQQGGWPLTMFLTPRGEPFWGGTYFPPVAAFGRPSFTQFISKVHEVYTASPESVVKNTSALLEALENRSRSDRGGEISLATLDSIAERLYSHLDPTHGGLAGAPKFPQCSLLKLIWRAAARTGEARYYEAVILALRHMSQGGIYDHLGGGYARYSVDAQWLVPHFEKMLYDNALILDVLCLAWQATGEALFEARIRQTVAWTLREMVAEGGAFAASLDADSEGREGTFYVWDKSEIENILGDRAAAFNRAYRVTARGNWEGHTILNRLGATEPFDDQAESDLAEGRAKLLAVRDKRVRPGWDDKVLADWNGLMIAALANAGAILDQPDWIEAASRAFAFIVDAMTETSETGERRLLHSHRGGRSRNTALLDDYATLARAALVLYEVTGDNSYIHQAEQWVTVLDVHYRDARDGGYFFTADDAEALIVRTKSATDQATPSGNGLLVGVLARLYYLTGETKYRARASDILDAFAGAADGNFAFATLLNSAETLEKCVQIVIIGQRDEPSATALIKAVHGVAVPDRLLTVVAPDQMLPATHPAFGKPSIDGKATAYVCVGDTCSLPVTEPEALRKTLRG